MFLDSQKPVVLFAGEAVDVLEENACRLFSTLDHLGALSQGRPFYSVRLVSECTGTLIVATEEEHEEVLRRFSHLSYMLHIDTSAQIPSARTVDKVVRRPLLLGEPVEAQGVPQAYLDGRFLSEEFPEAYQQARAFWSIGRSDKAIQILRGKSKTSLNPLDHYHLGCLLVFELKLFEEGRAALEEARRLSPASMAPLLALAMAFVMQEKTAEALPLLEEIEKRTRKNEKSPWEGDAEVWMHLARLYESSHRPRKAHKAVLRAFASDIDNTEAQAMLRKLEGELFRGPFWAKLGRISFIVRATLEGWIKKWR